MSDMSNLLRLYAKTAFYHSLYPSRTHLVKIPTVEKNIVGFSHKTCMCHLYDMYMHHFVATE